MDLSKRTFTLRIEDDMLDKISQIADKDRRSTNSLILSVLDRYIEDYEKKNGKLKSSRE